MDKKMLLKGMKLLGLVFWGWLVLSSWVLNAAEANIVLKTMVINPSTTKTQKAVLKAYLPKEVTPQDIVNLGDLKIDYNVEKGLYYVYKEVTLKPGESAVRELEIKDIWMVSEKGLEAISKQAREMIKQLKNTSFFETAVVLNENIEKTKEEIIRRQEQAKDASPQVHIASFRESTKRLDKIKADLAKIERMVLEYKLIAKGGSGKVSIRATWLAIVLVILGLAVLSLIFFVIWHKQAGVLKFFNETEEKGEKDQKKG